VRLWVGGTECQFHVQFLYNFFKCKILILGKFVAFSASCTLCTAGVKSADAKEVIRLTAGGHQVDNPQGQGLGITERTTTVLNI
jgi:hypothetical protein